MLFVLFSDLEKSALTETEYSVASNKHIVWLIGLN